MFVVNFAPTFSHITPLSLHHQPANICTEAAIMEATSHFVYGLDKLPHQGKPQAVSCILLLVALYTSLSYVHFYISALNYPPFPQALIRFNRTQP